MTKWKEWAGCELRAARLISPSAEKASPFTPAVAWPMPWASNATKSASFTARASWRGRRIGYRLYISQESVESLIAADPWRVNQSLLVFNPILEEIYSGSQVLRAGPQVDAGGCNVGVPHEFGDGLDVGAP